MIVINSKDINQYCEIHSYQDSEILQELIAFTYKNEAAPQMISGLQVGNILQAIIKLSSVKSILEIGMFTGYSALKMAESLPKNGKIYTCEIAENHILNAKQFFKRSEHGYKIKILEGDALKSINTLNHSSFDLCFIDADKKNYPLYYKKCIELLKPKGCLILDNMLWGGEVLNPKDDEAKAIALTGKLIQENNNIFNTLLTIRDGLMLCIKK